MGYMKKIGILTLYYKNYNYGGLLQAFALQKVIEELGTEAKQISYILDSGYPGYRHALFVIRKKLADVYHILKFGSWQFQFDKRRKALDRFANAIPHTRRVTAKTIGKLNDEFDFFVFGSDQIWNPIGWQPTLFGDFADSDKTKISYAASVAREELTENEFIYMGGYFNGFKSISIREQNATNYIKERFSDLNIECMPDPVFLLSKDEWMDTINNICEKQPIDSNYIVGYFLGNGTDDRSIAINYAESIKKRIIFFSHINKKDYKWEVEHSDLLTGACGPIEFIKCIHEADLILTDSFHGVAMSMILEKPFYVLPRFQNGDKRSMNSRITSILKKTGLEHRFVSSLNSSSDYILNENELDKMNAVLLRLRAKGIEYLKRNLFEG